MGIACGELTTQWPTNWPDIVKQVGKKDVFFQISSNFTDLTTFGRIGAVCKQWHDHQADLQFWAVAAYRLQFTDSACYDLIKKSVSILKREQPQTQADMSSGLMHVYSLTKSKQSREVLLSKYFLAFHHQLSADTLSQCELNYTLSEFKSLICDKHLTLPAFVKLKITQTGKISERLKNETDNFEKIIKLFNFKDVKLNFYLMNDDQGKLLNCQKNEPHNSDQIGHSTQAVQKEKQKDQSEVSNIQPGPDFQASWDDATESFSLHFSQCITINAGTIIFEFKEIISMIKESPSRVKNFKANCITVFNGFQTQGLKDLSTLIKSNSGNKYQLLSDFLQNQIKPDILLINFLGKEQELNISPDEGTFSITSLHGFVFGINMFITFENGQRIPVHGVTILKQKEKK